MKKVLLFLLGVSLFFASCKNPSQEETPKKKDSTLKQLVVKQGDEVVYDFRAPIDKNINVKLDKIVSKDDVLTIKAEPKDSSAKVTFDNASVASKEKSYEEAPPKVYIRVTNGSESTLYTLDIEEPPKIDAPLLKSLIVMQKDETLLDLSDPVPFSSETQLKEDISNEHYVLIKVIPKDEYQNAKILIDGVSCPAKEKKYTLYQKKIKVTIKNDDAKTDYIVTILKKGETPIHNTNLKSLTIKQGSTTLKSYSSSVPKSTNVTLVKKVNTTDHIFISAEKDDANAKVEIEGEEVSDKTYDSYVSKVNIKVTNESAESTYVVNIAKAPIDATLLSLVIKQKDVEVARFDKPVDNSISYTLDKKVSAEEYVEVEATPSDGDTAIKIDGDGVSKKRYNSLSGTITIVCTNDDVSETYTLDLQNPDIPEDNDSVLTRIQIMQKDISLKDVSTPVPSLMTIKLQKDVSTEEPILIKCTPKKAGAQVLFDNDTTSNLTKTYDSFKERVQITVKSDSLSTSYVVVFEAPTKPIPEDYTLKCNVVDSMGGTNVVDANIKVFEAGTNTKIEEGNTDGSGCAYFNLEANKYYDLVISKKRSAGSRVERMYIHENKKEFLPIVMRAWAGGAASIAPEISAVKMNTTPMGDLYEFNNNDSSSYIYITVKSKSGEIIPEEIGDNYNAGCYININAPFSVYDSPIIYASPVNLGGGKTIDIGSDGVVTQQFAVRVDRLVMQNGENSIYFICYDMAGNRCERHQRLNVKNGKLKIGDNTKNRFMLFEASLERYYRSLNTFGMPGEMGEATSVKVKFKFGFESPTVDIGKVDILRRVYQEGNIKDGWKVVSSRAYEKRYMGRGGVFTAYDDSNDLEEGKLYQYKLEAYNSRGKITSPVATLRVMEAYNVFLTSPSHRSAMPLNKVSKTDFSFKISDPSLWNKDKADYFLFDILVVEDQVYGSGNTSYVGVCFSSKMKWRFDKTGNDVLEIGKKSGNNIMYSPYKKISSQNNVGDLIKYNAGLVTITHKFMNTPNFNYGEYLGLGSNITSPGMYLWDVQDFGLDVLDVSYSDDSGTCFVKEYPYLDSKTGAVLSKGKSKSYSYSNLNGAGGAVNGRAIFIVKNN